MTSKRFEFGFFDVNLDLLVPGTHPKMRGKKKELKLFLQEFYKWLFVAKPAECTECTLSTEHLKLQAILQATDEK